MDALIIYDSIYGNTEQVAQAIGNALKSHIDVEVVQISNVNQEQLTGLKLLIFGSPTHGGSPTEAIRDFLKDISESTIRDVNVATFDTRFSTRWVKIFGYAAGKMANSLQKKGGILVTSPAPFFVKGKKGPLKDGELKRATSWGNELATNLL
ncbi:MAG: flavodoxin family protein [Promethearchaeota archaeon]